MGVKSARSRRKSGPFPRLQETSGVGSGPRIAIDAMGGDVGPAVMIAGAALAYQRRNDLSFLLFGDEAAIRTELSTNDALTGICEIVHCDDVIAAEDKPSQAIR